MQLEHGERKGDCVPCTIEHGLPTTPAHVWSYYLSQHGGRQLLVLNRQPNQRIRISERMELVVLAVREGEVELGIEYPAEGTSHREA